MTITLGGVTATAEEFARTLDVLRAAAGNQMKRYLKDTPLAGMDYLQVSRDEIAHFPEIQRTAGTRRNRVAHVKPANIHAIERELGADGRHGAPVASPKSPPARAAVPPAGQGGGASAALVFGQLFPAGVQLTAELLADLEQWARLTGRLASRTVARPVGHGRRP